MSKNRKANYRKIYAEYYGIAVPDIMDIHHIDEDRDNNDPSNLLMLPKSLHERYHKWKLEYDKMQRSSKCDGLLLGRNQYDFMVIAEFGVVCHDCVAWMAYKSHLDESKSLRCEHG